MLRPNNIVLFDGVCNLCNGFVQKLIRIDKAKKLHFASLQSDYAKSLLKDSIDVNNLHSVVFYTNEKLLVKSDAVLAIAKCIGGAYSLLAILKFFPRFIRDYVYDIIAANRYKWFGKQASCWMPNATLKERFLA